jgi:hypothetical protein
MSDEKNNSSEYTLEEGFDHVDSRGTEGSIKEGFLFPELLGDEEEFELEVMYFWEALEECVVNDQMIARVDWPEDYYLWVYGATEELGNCIMTFSRDQGCPTPYTPTQDDFFAQDWIMLPDSVTQ